MRAADVIVAVIGPQWVTIADERGRRRVLQPEEEDVVRTEIEAALRGGGRVVPVLVDDAALPARDALPRPFRPITALNAVTLAPRHVGPGPRVARRRAWPPRAPVAAPRAGAGERQRHGGGAVGARARRPGGEPLPPDREGPVARRAWSR